jgi:3-oxoacyl-[acyl-carrier protein] reductase
MNKTVVIIGASRGIGRQLVNIFAMDSTCSIYAFSRNIEDLQRDVFEYNNVYPFQLDLEDSNRKTTLENALMHLQQVDILINNAGKLVNKPFTELTQEDIRSCYEVNVMGVMETTQVLVPKMLENGGHIVNISSMGGFQGSVKFAGLSAYSTSKAAVASFTELFAEEYKETRIKTNCLCLGAAQTEMLEEAFPGYQAPLSAAEMATYIAGFAQNAHKYINGKIIPVSLSTP